MCSGRDGDEDNQAAAGSLTRADQIVLWVQDAPPPVLSSLHPGHPPTLSEDERAASMVQQNAAILDLDGLQSFLGQDLPEDYLYPPTIDFDGSLDEESLAEQVIGLLDHCDNDDGRQWQRGK